MEAGGDGVVKPLSSDTLFVAPMWGGVPEGRWVLVPESTWVVVPSPDLPRAQSMVVRVERVDEHIHLLGDDAGRKQRQ